MQLPTEIVNKPFYLYESIYIINEPSYIRIYIRDNAYYHASIDYNKETNSIQCWTMFFGKLVTVHLSIYEIQAAIKAFESSTTEWSQHIKDKLIKL